MFERLSSFLEASTPIVPLWHSAIPQRKDVQSHSSQCSALGLRRLVSTNWRCPVSSYFRSPCSRNTARVIWEHRVSNGEVRCSCPWCKHSSYDWDNRTTSCSVLHMLDGLQPFRALFARAGKAGGSDTIVRWDSRNVGCCWLEKLRDVSQNWPQSRECCMFYL